MVTEDRYEEGHRDGSSDVRADYQTWACGHITHLMQGDFTECPWCGAEESDTVAPIVLGDA